MSAPSSKVLTVSTLSAYIKQLLEGSQVLRSLTVVGEISNFKHHHPSGHLYFSLVDKGATISCVMFRQEASRLGFEPNSGVEVMVRGRVSLYEKTGRYQVYVEQMIPKGAGAKQLAYEALKAKLLEEGVFKSQDTRRTLPSFPKKIGIVTSQTGAVIRDMVRVLRRRQAGVDILLAPAAVQGPEAGPGLAEALERLYHQKDLDLIIIGRGGGSQEDLWCFNDENLVRKVAASPVPIISAVGHETDVTLTDFAADLRAGTPSMAAELAVPDREELAQALLNRLKSLDKAATGRLEYSQAQLQDRIRFALMYKVSDRLAIEAQNLDRSLENLRQGQERLMERRQKELAKRAELLDGLSPLKVLSRGYAVVEKEGKGVRSIKELSSQDLIRLNLQDGALTARVEELYGTER